MPRQRDTSGFDRLLQRLDTDRDRAGDAYERIRARITTLFAWRGCANADELADRTMERVERRLQEGADIYAGDPYAFFHGVALMVLRESWRDQARRATIEADLDDLVMPGLEEHAAQRERRSGCLDRCMAGLPASSRELLSVYHGQQGSAIAARQQFARTLAIPLTALRIRVHRLRVELRTSIEDCLGGPRAWNRST